MGSPGRAHPDCHEKVKAHPPCLTRMTRIAQQLGVQYAAAPVLALQSRVPMICACIATSKFGAFCSGLNQNALTFFNLVPMYQNSLIEDTSEKTRLLASVQAHVCGYQPTYSARTLWLGAALL